MLARRTIHKLAIGCALACALLVSAMSGAAAAQAGDVTQPAAHAQARYYSSYGEPEPLTLPQSPSAPDETPWLPIAVSIALALVVVLAGATRVRRLRVRRRRAARVSA